MICESALYAKKCIVRFYMFKNWSLFVNYVLHGRKTDAVDFLLLAQRFEADGQIKRQSIGRGIKRQCLQRRIFQQHIVQQIGKDSFCNSLSLIFFLVNAKLICVLLLLIPINATILAPSNAP